MIFELSTDQVNAPSFGWLPVDRLHPHPKNPRIGRPERLDAIIESMRVDGYRHEKPILVRPQPDDTYQIIGGHSRHAAAQAVGLEKVLCVVEPMDDEAAILRIAQDNINDPLPWYSICLYVFQNAVKDSKTGLSRTRLVMAATGKEGQAAANESKRFSDAGAVICCLLEQSCYIERLLDAEKNRRYHLVEIHQAPREHWPMLAGLLVEHDWSVKDTKSAVERVKLAVEATPDWLPMTDPNLLKRIALEPGFAKAHTGTLTALNTLLEKLPEQVTLYRLQVSDEIKEINGREHRRLIPEAFDYAPRESFIHRILLQKGSMTASSAESAYKAIMQYMELHSSANETWQPLLSDAEERERQARLKEIAAMELREAFRPRLQHGEVTEELRQLPSDHFDLVCIDPPYNVDKADWDSFGNGRDFAEWARPWLKECQRVLKPTGALYLFGVNRMLSHLQGELDGLGMRYRNWIIWDTIQGAGGGLWVNRHEAILYYSKTDNTLENTDAVKLERHEENVREYKGKEYAFKNPSNVWRFPCVDDKHEERTAHPTQKPVELIERIVLASSPPEGLVLDCFIGSGTTGVACMRQRRYCVGIDQNRDYLAIAEARFDTTDIGS